MRLLLSEIARMLGLPPVRRDCAVTGYSIDSRALAVGDLFFAIRGPRFDGHSFVEAALKAGAAAAVVERGWAGAHPAVEKVLAVEDPVAALGLLARQSRRRWAKPVVAVTGSNGKTTTKDATAALLGAGLRVAKTEGNLNNELGLPLSILRMDDAADIAVLEMGMNHSGEIRRLASIAGPTVGVVTNVSGAHLGNFSSVEEIALAKRELIESLPREGTAVLNADDERVAAFAAVHPGRSFTFGVERVAIERPADFTATGIESHGAEGTSFDLAWRDTRSGARQIRLSSPLIGRHNVSNVLAAVATAAVFGVDPASLLSQVARLRPSALRGEVQKLGDITLLKDCYNANPSAMAAMIETLNRTAGRRKIAVLGEMLELGEASASLHREIGRQVAAIRPGLLIGVQGNAQAMVDEAVRSGLPADQARFFPTAEEAGKFVAAALASGDVVLLKASRGVALEEALPAIERRALAC
jgi:UDP-N-acetylmuramoyl-tripeptide--D-alanyl-D-alanine ligase